MESLPLWAGTVVCALAAAGGLLPLPLRTRLACLSFAMLLAPVLIAADNWDSEQVAELRDRPELLAVAAVGGAIILAAAAAFFRRLPWLVIPVAIAVVPFRIPVDLGSSTVNLLLPLYVVLAAALLATWLTRRADDGPEGSRPPRGLGAAIGPLLAAAVVVYALQSGYADDVSAALENVCFFFAPFATLFFLLQRASWDRRLLRAVVWVLAVEALVVVLIGFGQYVGGDLFWNDKVIAGNEAHAWFRVNSLFYDPNIMGRFLAVTMIVVAGVATWGRPREQPAAAALFVLLLAGLAITFSQSSLLALIGGLLVLGLARWGLVPALAAAGAVAVCIVLAVSAVDAGSLEAETTGRDGLISGGLELAAERPLHGYGSGSFAAEFEQRFGPDDGIAVASHTEPVTVAAEQGLVGMIPYLALVFGAAWVLAVKAGLGLRGARGPLAATVLAAFAAMVVHSLGYAAFLVDPITWTLLGVAAALPAAGRSVS